LLKITFFTREGCHLCDQALEDLQVLQTEYPHQVVVIDIDSDPDLLKKYSFEIPVVEVGPYTLKAPFDQRKLAMTLGAAQDRQNQLEKIADTDSKKKKKRSKEISGTDRFSLWLSRHYLLVFNLFVLVYAGLPFLAPVLLKVGAETPAHVIYRIYSGLCHQLSYRSWFMFGEQPIYPRAAAGIEGYLTFHEATGLDEQGLLDARAFLGNEFTGYKIALCQRDVAIYLSILLFGILFGLTGRRIKPLPLWIWFLVGIVPIGVDGFSQLLSQFISFPELSFLQPFLGFLPYRESTPFLRTLTGFLFGFTTAWFGYPLVEETMADARRLLTTKFAKLEHTKP
jgi:uncharacterized membrane protein